MTVERHVSQHGKVKYTSPSMHNHGVLCFCTALQNLLYDSCTV